MAFLNGKFTAFDPHIELVAPEDDENTMVVTGEMNEIYGDSITVGALSENPSDIEDAYNDGKTICFIIQAPPA